MFLLQDWWMWLWMEQTLTFVQFNLEEEFLEIMGKGGSARLFISWNSPCLRHDLQRWFYSSNCCNEGPLFLFPVLFAVVSGSRVVFRYVSKPLYPAFHSNIAIACGCSSNNKPTERVTGFITHRGGAESSQNTIPGLPGTQITVVFLLIFVGKEPCPCHLHMAVHRDMVI